MCTSVYACVCLFVCLFSFCNNTSHRSVVHLGHDALLQGMIVEWFISVQIHGPTKVTVHLPRSYY